MNTTLDDAHRLVRAAILEFRDQPVGTVAAFHPELPAENYGECFVRDFVPSALVFLMEGEYEIVRNFLRIVLEVSDQQRGVAGHDVVPGVMPASFKITKRTSGDEQIMADFGDRAIGRVAPVDSMLWWIGILGMYVEVTGDRTLAEETDFQNAIREILELLLRDTFEIYPTLLTPDACCMIDRRMGIYGHPLEVQSLFYGILRTARNLLIPSDETRHLLKLVQKREEVLRDYVRKYYWLDLKRLNEIHRYKTEQFGHEITNVFNIFPESIPEWITDWLPDEAGYLAGSIGPGRLDFRFFALGNLVAILVGLATRDEANRIMKLYEMRWDDLVGMMPLKICFPAIEGIEWRVRTGCDSKNVPWSYHNGGNWPALLWAFTGAALRVGRDDLARRAFEIASRRLLADSWPEYYDGKSGRLIGRRASFNQVWSAAALIASHRLLEDPTRVSLLSIGFPEELASAHPKKMS